MNSNVGILVKKTVLFLLAFSLPMWAHAQTQYVSDKLVIMLRSGQGNQYQILKALPSGSKLTVLEEEVNGYTRVETEEGLEGWVRSQYLIDEPIALYKLERTDKKLARVAEQNKLLRIELDELKKNSSLLDAERKDYINKFNTSSAELKRLTQVAAKPILMDKQNRDLKQSNVSLEKDLQLMQQENQVLKDRSQREWFITGAVVLLGGIILGLIIPKIRWQKKSSW